MQDDERKALYMKELKELQHKYASLNKSDDTYFQIIDNILNIPENSSQLVKIFRFTG